ncbi:hypothetical protein BVC80_117g14 [Macleaya cordata]|uniref:F-box associated beta-propeller type 3 domain-containing protein n=1 Tax=Macleaya cordata TaxID=56857 RepID=A0A200QR29_MACCD|nr:hypothetical protein BVC80_117g14 [Macleaya cordata]
MLNNPTPHLRGSTVPRLICFSIPHHGLVDDPINICNPITREYVILPSFNIEEEYKVYRKKNRSYRLQGRIVSGFGYHPSTKEYKVVRIYFDGNQFFGRVQVYTIGGGSGWRDKGEIPYSFPYYYSESPPQGILANGSLHWVDNEERIVAFDLAKE